MSFITKLGEKIILPAAQKAFRTACSSKPAAKKIIPLVEKVPQKSSHSIILDAGYTVSKSGNSGEIYPFFNEVRNLLNETVVKYNGQTAKRFKARDIEKLAPLMKDYPAEVRKLIKELRFSPASQDYVPRFNAREISELAPLMKENPEISEILIKESKLLAGKNNGARFSGGEIADLIPIMKKYPQEVKELLNMQQESCKLIVQRFNAGEIKTLAPVLQKYPETVRNLLKETTTSVNGNKIFRFKAQEVADLAPAMNNYPEIMGKFLKETKSVDGKIVQKYNSKSFAYIAKNIQEYSMVTDEKVLSEINELISHEKFSDADALIDAMNNITGKYNTIFGTYHTEKIKGRIKYETEDTLRFIKYLKSEGMSVEKLEKGEVPKLFDADLKWKRLSPEILAKDFKLDCKYSRMGEYIKTNPDSEISNYLYNKYYLADLEKAGVKQKVIEWCKKINEKYNVKIMPSTDSYAPLRAIDALEKELQRWINASEGKAKLPPVIEFCTAKANWYDRFSAYGKSVAEAYSHPGYNGALAFDMMRDNIIKRDMRHEMTHTNDLKHGCNIPKTYNLDEIMPHHIEIKDGRKIQINEPKKGKYYNEFKNAGLSDHYINYAYNNPKEFIAVAAQGDMSKYSEEFKQVLVDFGMPEWELNFGKV